MKNLNKKLIYAGVCILIAILFTVLVSVCDRAIVSPHGVDVTVGFSHINNSISSIFGYNQMWYKVTGLIGYSAVALVAVVALFGLLQLIVRKGLFKVDAEIFALGITYVLMFVLYIAFDKIAINCRPMILPDETALEPSYPSSHTMLACTVFGSIYLASRKYCKKTNIRIIVQSVCMIICMVAAVGRLFSGVHWFTDVLGSIFISCALLSVYHVLLEVFRIKLKKNKSTKA